MISVSMFGLGNMGAPMSVNLLRSSTIAAVGIHGRSRDRVSALISEGAVWHDDPGSAAAAGDVIISVLPDIPELEALMDGPHGILAGLRGPTHLIICSTSSPQRVRDFAESAIHRSGGLLHVLDAPVSGGTDGATAATLSIMVGGDVDDYEAVEPVLRVLGEPVHLGPLGAGSVAKSCNQLVVAATIMAWGEACVIAARSGLDVEKMLNLLSKGYAGGRLLDTRIRRFVEEDYSVSGPAKFMIKDLTFAQESADLTATRADQLELLRTLFIDLADAGFGENDIAVTRAFVAGRDA